MTFKSINPYKGKVIAEYPEHSDKEVDTILQKSRDSFELWCLPIEERGESC